MVYMCKHTATLSSRTARGTRLERMMHALHRLRINRTRQINLKVIATWSASAAMKTCPAELSSGLFVLLLPRQKPSLVGSVTHS